MEASWEIEGREGTKGEKKWSSVLIDYKIIGWHVRGMKDPNEKAIIKEGFKEGGVDVKCVSKNKNKDFDIQHYY